MQILYNQLMSPVIETNEKGEQVQHPPSALMMKAARAIKQLSEINDNNTLVIQCLQKDINFSVDRALMLEKEIYQLKAQQRNLYSQLAEKDSNDSIHEDRGQTSPLGSDRVDPPGSDRTSEGGVQAEGPNPSTD